MKQPNALLVREGRGMGWDSVCVSLYDSYSNYADFARALDANLSDLLLDTRTFQIDPSRGILIKPFNLRYQANLKPKSEKN